MKARPEYDHSGHSGRKAGILSTLLLFLCIIAVAFLSYQRSLNPEADLKDVLQVFQLMEPEVVKEAQLLYTYEFDEREKPTFVLYKEYIVKCSNSGIWFLDKAGEVVRSEGIIFNNPIIKTNGSLLLVADQGAGEICVLDDKAVRWREKVDASILNADISNNGYVTVITSAKRDNNEVRVFESHGLELFRKIIANDFAVSARFSPSDKYLAVSGISAGAAGAFSHYKFYDMEGKDLAGITFDTLGDLLPLFWFSSGNIIFAAGDRAVASFDSTGKFIWDKQFRNVAGAEPAGINKLAVTGENENGAVLQLYSAEGQELFTSILQGKPEGLNAIKGIISVNTSDTVYFYNEKGRNISKFFAGSTVKQVYFFNRQQAAVLCNRELRIININ